MTEMKVKKYLLGNDLQEAERLNFQHSVLFKLTDGNLLHPSIDKAQVLKVADVGTGTGIWLEELSNQLKDVVSGSAPPRQYDGFDLSTVLFPGTCEKNIRFIQHDTLEPFPEEYHNIYDVVHVRFMALAFKGSDWKLSVQNLTQLLKPRGYLQWDEFDQGLWSHDPSFTKVCEALAIGQAFTAKIGFSAQPSLDVMAAFEEVGLKDIVKEEYSSTRHPELTADYRIWGEAAGKTGWLPVALLHGGRAGGKQEADEMAEKMLQGWDEDYANGAVPFLPVFMMVGRKP